VSDPAAIVVCPRCAGRLVAEAADLRCTSCGVRFPTRGGVWDLTSGARPPSGYDAHYVPGIAVAEDRHFWFVTRREWILNALRRHVPELAARRLFDIGCGTGGLVGYLSTHGVSVAGACDSFPEGLAVTATRVAAPLFLVDEGRLPPLAPAQDLISLFDVLEHIDDDRATLREVAGVLRPGGSLVLTVPAHPFLFDEADRLAHHRRRYRRAELRQKLEEAGLVVDRLTHFMALLVPGLFAARGIGAVLQPVLGDARKRRDRELRVVPGVNGLLRAALRGESLWLRFADLPIGTSLLAVAHRPR
jgi:SAM-dependent methyltransferase